MKCPQCGLEVEDDTLFCPKCGTPIPTKPKNSSEEAEDLMKRVRAASDAADEAKSQTRAAESAGVEPTAAGYQAGPVPPSGAASSYGTSEVPPNAGQYDAGQNDGGPYGAGPVPPEYGGASPAPQESKAPLVLGIVGLVLSVIGLFPVGLVLCIIGLVLGRKLSPQNAKAPRILNIIGLIISGLLLVITLIIGGMVIAFLPQIIEEMEDAGYPTSASTSSLNSNSSSSSSSSNSSSSNKNYGDVSLPSSVLTVDQVMNGDGATLVNWLDSNGYTLVSSDDAAWISSDYDVIFSAHVADMSKDDTVAPGAVSDIAPAKTNDYYFDFFVSEAQGSPQEIMSTLNGMTVEKSYVREDTDYGYTTIYQRCTNKAGDVCYVIGSFSEDYVDIEMYSVGAAQTSGYQTIIEDMFTDTASSASSVPSSSRQLTA